MKKKGRAVTGSITSKVKVQPLNAVNRQFRSKFEQKIADNLIAAGLPATYETVSVAYQKKIRGECNACGSNDVHGDSMYTPDFLLPNGIFIEAKGKFTSRDRTKILSVLESNNEITRENFRILFMYDNWLTKRKLKRYSDWCDQHNIKWAVGPEVPEEWMTECTK